MENGFINEFGIKIVLKSFEERVLIFTTCIENLYIFKVTNHEEDCKNNQSQKWSSWSTRSVNYTKLVNTWV